MPALRHAAARGGSVLGLPSFVDHLFDVPALPPIARGLGWVLRPRRETAPADRRGASRLLDRVAARSRPGVADPRAGLARFGIAARVSGGPTASAPFRGPRGIRPGGAREPRPPGPAPHRSSSRAGASGHRGDRELDRSRDALRRPGRLTESPGLAARGRCQLAGQVGGAGVAVRLIFVPGSSSLPGAGSWLTTMSPAAAPPSFPTLNPSATICDSARARGTQR